MWDFYQGHFLSCTSVVSDNAAMLFCFPLSCWCADKDCILIFRQTCPLKPSCLRHLVWFLVGRKRKDIAMATAALPVHVHLRTRTSTLPSINTMRHKHLLKSWNFTSFSSSLRVNRFTDDSSKRFDEVFTFLSQLLSCSYHNNYVWSHTIHQDEAPWKKKTSLKWRFMDRLSSIWGLWRFFGKT